MIEDCDMQINESTIAQMGYQTVVFPGSNSPHPWRKPLAR